MKVICFKGVTNSGKSKTIKRVLNGEFKIKIYPDKKDFRISFEWKGLKILLCGCGDSLACMKPVFEEINPKNYDVFICACHPRNDVYNKLISEFGLENINFINCINGESEEEYERRIELFMDFLNSD